MSDPAFHRGIPPLPPVDIEKLASLLHADRQKGLARLELLERRLLKFFQWERVPNPKERADETVRRALVRLSEGVEMLSPETDFLEIARAVARDAPPPRRRPAGLRGPRARTCKLRRLPMTPRSCRPCAPVWTRWGRGKRKSWSATSTRTSGRASMAAANWRPN